MGDHPIYLDPSELGTKEYWDKYYQNDLDQNEDDEDNENVTDPSDLESWFDDVNAPTKVLEYLTADTFPLSPANPSRTDEGATVLDLGTGNGGMLFTLRIEGGYRGQMVGVDYSQSSVDLATRLWQRFRERDATSTDGADIRFERVDLIRDDPRTASWWPEGGFGLVLDKGTFDAISLSEETVDEREVQGRRLRICELYPRKVIDMVATSGFLLITSCNWTEEEVMKWFLHGDGVEGRMKVFGKIKYPVYEFGGQVGQGVASVCFQKV